MRVLLISTDLLPLKGFPTTGAGLRAWSLGQGLLSRGHDVVFSMPEAAFEDRPPVEKKEKVVSFDYDNLPGVVEKVSPDVIILQYWALALGLPDCRIPIAIDMHGPNLLENYFNETLAVKDMAANKMAAFNRADFFTCAGRYQKGYFLPWLMMAGVNMNEARLEVIPVSLSPELPEKKPFDELEFVYGGVFLPWQDPRRALYLLVEEMESAGSGKLKFFGGKHPLIDVIGTGDFGNIVDKLKESSRVELMGMVGHDGLLEHYAGAAAAVDLMERNPERELAFTTRTVEYMWCGLPVIYNNYSELSVYIEKYNAGWTLEPTDDEAIRKAIKSILNNRDMALEYGLNAQKLVRENLTWDRTIDPLDEFCRKPYKVKNFDLMFDSGTETDITDGKLDRLVRKIRKSGPYRFYEKMKKND